MRDLIANNIIGHGRSNLINELTLVPAFNSLTEINWPQDISYHLNLVWPGQSGLDAIPAENILISFHTEQMDVDWIYDVSKLYPSSKIIVLFDGYVEYSEWWPDNIIFVRYITWHHQLDVIIKNFGPIVTPEFRQYKASSLVSRPSQFKTLVTSWILTSNLRDQFIMSWANKIIPSTDTHVHAGTGNFYLDFLTRYIEEFNEVIELDDFNDTVTDPITNSNWHIPAYENCVFNLTNESFHYSLSNKNGCEFKYPGVYLTEKTWKPLIAGCGIIAVGQQHTYQALRQLGFRFEYGIDLSFDEVAGDIERIMKILTTLESFVAETDIHTLNSMVLPSAAHNQEHILNGTCARACNNINNVNLSNFQARI